MSKNDLRKVVLDCLEYLEKFDPARYDPKFRGALTEQAMLLCAENKARWMIQDNGNILFFPE